MSFDPADPIGSVFAPVLGKPGWNVRAGYGSAFMLEFGEPHLEVREPAASTSDSEKVQRLLAKRHVTVLGEWSLLIEFCGWQVLQNEIPVATSDAEPPNIKAIVDTLDGQCLTSVSGDGACGTSRFAFDLGGVIETARFDDELLGDWFLLTPEEMCLTYRGDGTYSWGRDTLTDDEHVWVPLPR